MKKFFIKNQSIILFLLNLVMFFNSAFSQTSISNVVPYLEGKKTGLQVSPLFTGIRSSISNQETDFNIALFYHNRLDLRDNEILGVLQSRLISETPLTSFDFIKMRSDRIQESLSNYLLQMNVFQDALQKYQDFQNQTVEQIEEAITELEDIEENYYYYDDYDSDEYYYYDEEPTVSAQASSKNDFSLLQVQFKAQLSSVSNLSHFEPFPSMDHSDKSISEKELEFLVRYEKLKQQYNKAVEEYNLLMSQETQEIPFDPADPSEYFTVMLAGDNSSTVWSKDFGLDGKTNYQSYNDYVWYLGYQVPLTKKDLQQLYNIFTKNKKVVYYIKGTQGTIQFSLSSYLINTIKELLELYVRRGLKIDNKVEFPILRNQDENLK